MPNEVAPTVSICIPCYRGAAHIGAAIESVLAQTYADFELVIIDDGSPDNTAEVIAGYDDPRIRFLQNAGNLGPERNWNRCLSVARGRFFKLLPQDDVIAPECLAMQVEVLEKDQAERIALVFCSRTILDGRDRAIMVRGFSRGRSGPIPAREVIRQCLRRGTNAIGEPGSVLFRTKLIETAGKFDASIPYVLDLDYWFRLLLNGDAYYLAQPLASFRVSSGSWSVRIGAGQSRDFRQFIEKISAKPEFSAKRLDVVRGHIMAKANSMLRMVVYRFVIN